VNDQLLGFMVFVAPWIALFLYTVAVGLSAATGMMSLKSTRVYTGIGLFLCAVPLFELLAMPTRWSTVVAPCVTVLWSIARLVPICTPVLLGWMILQQRKAGHRVWLCLCVDSCACFSLLSFSAFSLGLRML